jgi:hypothetical protein
MSESLKPRQQASGIVEKQMIVFLMQFTPTQALTVADVKIIAEQARNISFEAFSAAICGD